MLYEVTYFYLASGMEGRPDIENYGTVEADSKEGAVEKALKRAHPVDKFYGSNNQFSTNRFIRGCLSAKAQPPKEAYDKYLEGAE